MPASFNPLSIFDTLQTFVTGQLVPAVVGLVVITTTVSIAIKAATKRAKAAK